VQAFFESAIYIFVFLWTPSLNVGEEHAPLGFIFGTFMLAIMVGRCVHYPPEGRIPV